VFDCLGVDSIDIDAIPDEPVQRPAFPRAGVELDPEDSEDSEYSEYQPPEHDAAALLRYLRAGATADVELVTGRDGVERPIVLVDFEPAVRGRLYRLVPSLAYDPVIGTGFDLLRLDLAFGLLEDQQPEAKILAPVSWPALADPDCRPAFDRRLAQLSPSARSRIMLAVGALRRQLGDIGLLLTHRDGELAAIEDAITNEWPLSLLVVDRTEGPPVLIEEYRSLFAAARRREISVLVRTTARNDIRDWRKLGATMFATTA
jgi:hypothetical protein